MGIADDMKKIAEDIVASYDMRVKAIEELVKDTHKMLKGFQNEHKEMAVNLKESLEKGETDRLKSFKVMIRDIDKGIKDIETYVTNLLNEYSSDMKKAKAAWKGMSKTLKKARRAGVMVGVEEA